MSVTEAERHHLYESLKAHLGAAPADTFMNLIPPGDWSHLATKADLQSVKADLHVEIGALRADLLRTLGTWLFASQAAVVTAVAVIVAIGR
jgi:hypothetical protein